MDYKPDKFEKSAVKISTIVMVILLSIPLFIVTVVRFADDSEPLFSVTNILRAVAALLGFAAVGGLLYKAKKESEK